MQKAPADVLEFMEQFPDELACIKFLEAILWDGKPTCTHCGHERYYPYKDGKRYKCAKCRQIYNIKLKTPMEGTKIPLRKWFMAIYLFSNHKKGVSSHQIARDVGITQDSAWFMLQRIREMMINPIDEHMKGIVEADETSVGGKIKFKRKHVIEAMKLKYGNLTGNVGKTPVLGILERGGNVAMMVIQKTDGKTIKPILKAKISPDARLITDTAGAYYGLSKHFKSHETVNHTIDEYVRGDVTTNNLEGLWNHFKRMIAGTYHYISPGHLQRYCDEHALRWNTRKYKTEFERFTFVITKCKNKRLRYQELITNQRMAA